MMGSDVSGHLGNSPRMPDLRAVSALILVGQPFLADHLFGRAGMPDLHESKAILSIAEPARLLPDFLQYTLLPI